MSDRNRQFVRLMSSSDPAKAYRQLADFARKGGIEHGMVIAEVTTGEIHVIGQKAGREDMARLMLAASSALVKTGERAAIDPVKPEVEPEVGQGLGKDTGMIAEEWASLSKAVHHSDTPSVQRSESRRMFYAGVAALLKILTTRMDPGEQETDADMARMDAIAAELNAFGAALHAGSA
jgi:hypothetical protein